MAARSKSGECGELIPELPDELATLCLIRVPRFGHGIMRQVSSYWKQLVDSKLFAEERKRCGFTEEIIILLPLIWDNRAPFECREVDPRTGRVSGAISYSHSMSDEDESRSRCRGLVFKDRYCGIGDRLFAFGFECDKMLQATASTLLEVDTFDRTIKFAPSIPHLIDMSQWGHGVIDGKLWVSFPEGFYDVYDPETGTWTETVSDLPPGWIFGLGRPLNARQIFGYMPSPAVIRNLTCPEDVNELCESYLAVTSRGLFFLSLYGDPGCQGWAEVHKLDLTLPEKEQTGKAWTKIWRQLVRSMKLFWLSRFVALKDTIVLVVPARHPWDDIVLEEVSPGLLRVPVHGSWKVAVILK